MRFLRLFHSTASRCLLLSPVVHVEKTALAKLRKATGYSFSKCKEALQKHENDLSQAEQWLRSEAQAHGWEKATKLQGRATAQGLVSILASSSAGVMMEINCETDFVARNKKFQTLAQKITHGCYQFSNDQHLLAPLSKIPLIGEKLANLPLLESRTIKDEIALSIGEIGENINARRAVCLKSTDAVMIAGYTHPAPDGTATATGSTKVVMHGRYGAIVAFRQTGTESVAKNKKSMHLIGRQLCQHIIGMNPKEIGSMDQPVVDADESENLNAKPTNEVKVKEPEQSGVERSGVEVKEEEENPEEEEEIRFRPEVIQTMLVNQEFLLDPDITIREFLIQNSVEVLDFVRYECGETIEPTYCE